MRMRSLAGVCALAGAVLWAGAPASAQSMSSATAGPPPLSIVSPTAHARVKNPVSVVLQTTGDMAHLATGGMSMDTGSMSGMGPGVHLHIVIDDHLLMPTASQLVKVGTDRYRYTFGPLSPGPHTIKAYWAANKTHKPVGAIQTVTCTVIP